MEVERTPDEDIIHFKVAGTDIGYFNTKSLQLFGPGNSIYIGEDAGNSDNGTAINNTIVGSFAGSGQTSAFDTTVALLEAEQTNIGQIIKKKLNLIALIPFLLLN